jgi:hypothetical protein
MSTKPVFLGVQVENYLIKSKWKLRNKDILNSMEWKNSAGDSLTNAIFGSLNLIKMIRNKVEKGKMSYAINVSLWGKDHIC